MEECEDAEVLDSLGIPSGAKVTPEFKGQLKAKLNDPAKKAAFVEIVGKRGQQDHDRSS